jgi:cytoskeleton protein RodZ
VEKSNDSPDSSANAPKPTGVGPGERLQAARIEMGLSVQDVANRMHLSGNILESIEENNFDEITAPIFVKGYLRAYARIVSLDEDEMIQQYVSFYSEEDPPITSTSNMAPELSAGDARIKWTTYLVILVLAALLAVWWWNKERNQAAGISLGASSNAAEQIIEESSQPVVSEIEAVSESIVSTESDQVEITESTEASEQSNETLDANSEVVAESDNSVDETADQSVVEIGSNEQQADEEVITEEENSSSETLTNPQATVSETGVYVGTRSAPTGSDKLKIIVHADTWADIKDGTDHQLVYDLIRAGQSMDLAGKAPFAVFFGNGHGVEMSFNNQEINLTSLIRDDNTARINIGQ